MTKPSAILLLLFLLPFLCFSQSDSEHWFAPMGSNTPADGTGIQRLYLSTASLTPVTIKIYSGNILVGSTTVKKGAPGFFYDMPREQMIVEDNKEKMKVLKKGLHLIGDGNFFANYRFSMNEDAELITSKGRSALGKTFYLGMNRVKVIFSNYIAGIIATEDNTTVTLSNYESTLIFTNDSTPNAVKRTVRLNKGESYLFEVDNVNRDNFKYNGLIGAKIESDKPVSVTSGNFLGGVNLGRDYFTDIFMDQVIPVEKIGTEYIVMSGNGDMAESTMEKTLIVAAEDNTAVFLNNNSSGTPDFILPKAGSFQFLENGSYQAANTAENIYTLYIKTSKPSYVYQILAGNPDNDRSTGAMNIIPPLSCLLPSKIDEISAVDENLNMNGGSYMDNFVKLNIITQKNANVFVNNKQDGLLGPFPVPGTLDWEVYSLPDAKGDITVSTDNKKSVTVGLAAGNPLVGYGGYFAGFSVDPFISRIGGCDNFKYLEVQDNFDSYEWYYSADLINWTKLPEVTNRLDPKGQYGYYKCRVSKQFCPPAIDTEVFLYDKCTVTGPPKEFTLSFCENLAPPITPEFSTPPSKPVNPSKTKITAQPAEGKAYVDKDGKVYYEPNNTRLDQVTFTYYFEGTETFPDSEEIKVTVFLKQMATRSIDLFSCVDNDNFGIYNLKEFETANSDPSIVKFQYYEDSALTKEINMADISNYRGKVSTVVYVKTSDSSGCFRITEIYLKTYTPPAITIQIDGKTATINATGGLPPYEYAIENSNGITPYQNSNTFRNLPFGLNTAYVLSSDKCTIASQDFMITHFPNFISPNGDGFNDYLDFNEMKNKAKFSLVIFDRQNKILFRSSGESYIWEGKYNSKTLATDAYWYFITWEEPQNKQTYKQTGYILIKNRD
ncbi:T9SS type B sorting domain-containing protein [Kaistella sp. DKR-2]|uniref:T9SS type B sorting domain-containing protein n=1 Tax=Kaistella soli TaxID=2849654 RepID=UPI001C26837F|nr:T9SS type B sorting domain-containing protein [Kaistella soli]MBU8884121.1 T9SS type B sorting domain-containing protein [Kaistella soli]